MKPRPQHFSSLFYPPGQRWEGHAPKAFAVMQPSCKRPNGVQILDGAPDTFSFWFFLCRQEIEPEPSEGALYSRFMSQSLREGGGAISKFYIIFAGLTSCARRYAATSARGRSGLPFYSISTASCAVDTRPKAHRLKAPEVCTIRTCLSRREADDYPA